MDSNKYNILNWLFKYAIQYFNFYAADILTPKTFFGLGITLKVTEVFFFLSFEKITVTMLKLNVFTIFNPIVISLNADISYIYTYLLCLYPYTLI